MTSPDFAFRLTERATVATSAQKKLLHIVFILKVWLISYRIRQLCLGYSYEGQATSIENNTPPMGEPKATATPAALAAVTISFIFTARHRMYICRLVTV